MKINTGQSEIRGMHTAITFTTLFLQKKQAVHKGSVHMISRTKWNSFFLPEFILM